MSVLDELIMRRRASVSEAKRRTPVAAHRDAALARTDRRDFTAALRAGRTGTVPAIVAEFKRRSPSAGDIDPAADPAAVSSAYERGGAAALSVLTEASMFGGSLDDLRVARAACGLPVLCKDFIVDAYQVWEAAAAGADAVLLIAAILDDNLLRGLFALASALQVTPLVEVHDGAEALRAIGIGVRLIGVNNRDLGTFDVHAGTAARVASSLPPDCFVVAESGYRSAEDVAASGRAGAGAVLVGEALMRSSDKETAVRLLRGER
ncbi:MAG TPA: indole-3-glycerol phosphate synthase TrpC [Candidatus Eremiobacteraceae bacterium]